MRELAATYQAEARERLEAITRLLLDLEEKRTPADVPAQVELIYRELHSLKGAARSIGAAAPESVAHAFEESLAGVRGAKSVPRAKVAEWFEQLDRLRATIVEDGGPTAAGPPAANVPEVGRISSAAVESGVRVATERLDHLMEDLGNLIVSEKAQEELVVGLSKLVREIGKSRGPADRVDSAARADAELAQFKDRLKASARGLDGVRVEMHRQLQALDDDVRGLRMTPIRPLFLSFERMLRDLAMESGKQIELEVTGEDTELDRSIIDQLRDPLVHLLRNAIDHGVESPDKRLSAGKLPHGRIQLAAIRRSREVVITIRDDGRGIDPALIRRRSVELKLLPPAEAEHLPDTEITDLLFQTGFSTHEAVSMISGRGLGLAIVRQAMDRVRGSVAVESAGPGQGTLFTITAPLTVATTRCFLLRAGAETYAIPIDAIQRIMLVDVGQVSRVEGRPTIAVDGRAALFLHLAALLNRKSVSYVHRLPVLVFDSASGLVAIAGDDIRGEQDLVVKAFPAALPLPPNLAGAATLASGEVVLVVEPTELVAHAMRSDADVPELTLPESAERHRPLVLVADDSLTTRTLERSVLLSAGYDVTAVADGTEAWRALQTLRFELLVSDIEMPGVDGVTLTERVRASPSIKDLPVVLVSALARPEDRLRGLDAGADAYIAKSDFRQTDLVETVDRLLGRVSTAVARTAG